MMALFGHKDLYVSPNDGGFDPMHSGYILLDVLDDLKDTKPMVHLTLAPLLSPAVGVHPAAHTAALHEVLLRAFDSAAASTDARSGALIRPCTDLPALVRLSLPHAAPLVVDALQQRSLAQSVAAHAHAGDALPLYDVLVGHVPQLLPFLSPGCFDIPGHARPDPALPRACVIEEADLEIRFLDRKGTRAVGALNEVAQIYSFLHVAVRAEKLWNIAHYQLHGAAPTPPCPLPAEHVPFAFTFMRVGRPNFKGHRIAQWHPHEVDAHLRAARGAQGAGPSPFDEFMGAGVAGEAPPQHKPLSATPAAAPSTDAFPPAHLHPGCAVTTTAYYLATRGGMGLLQRAKQFDSLEQLLPHFDLVVGTSALAKKVRMPRRAGKDDDASSRVLRPWELADILVRSVADHERRFRAASDAAPAAPSTHEAAPNSPNARPSADVGLRAPPLRVLLVMGRETSGLTAEELAMCDHLVTIPGPSPAGGTLFSLNLAHATGILLYEVSRLRQLLTRALQQASAAAPLFTQSQHLSALPASAEHGGCLTPPACAAPDEADARAHLGALHSATESSDASLEVALLRQRVRQLELEREDLCADVKTAVMEVTAARRDAAGVDVDPLADAPSFEGLSSPYMRSRMWHLLSGFLDRLDTNKLSSRSASSTQLRERAVLAWIREQKDLPHETVDTIERMLSSHDECIPSETYQDVNSMSLQEPKRLFRKGDVPPPVNSTHLFDYALSMRKLLFRPDVDEFDLISMRTLFKTAELQLRVYQDALDIRDDHLDGRNLEARPKK
jgi:tRNA C32,U32 (ribose-2'-O)-methylase TrmJ